MHKTKRTFECVVVGDVLFDVVVEGVICDGELTPRGTCYLDYAQLTPGGSGNIAAGMSLLGSKTAFIGKAGRDMLGKIYEEDLASKGITVDIFYSDELPTGVAIVLIEPGGERSFLVFKGSNSELRADEIESSKGLIGNSEYLYMCGYSVVSPSQQSAVLKAVDIALGNGVRVVFDPGAYNLIQSERRLFERLLASCDVFCPNLEEALAITNTKSLDMAVEHLRESTALTALKLGAKGSILVCGKETVRTPAFKVGPVDTTGAGDAFTAGIVYGLNRNLPLDLTARLANWYASQIITSYGARCYPPREKILAFLKDLAGTTEGSVRGASAREEEKTS